MSKVWKRFLELQNSAERAQWLDNTVTCREIKMTKIYISCVASVGHPSILHMTIENVLK